MDHYDKHSEESVISKTYNPISITAAGFFLSDMSGIAMFWRESWLSGGESWRSGGESWRVVAERWRRWFEAVFSEMWARLYLASNIVRDCNVYVFDVVRDVCLKGSVCDV